MSTSTVVIASVCGGTKVVNIGLMKRDQRPQAEEGLPARVAAQPTEPDDQEADDAVPEVLTPGGGQMMNMLGPLGRSHSLLLTELFHRFIWHCAFSTVLLGGGVSYY